MGVVKKTVSFDPEVFKAVEQYQKNLIKEHLEPVSFSKALNDLLRNALEPLETLEPLEDVES